MAFSGERKDSSWHRLNIKQLKDSMMEHVTARALFDHVTTVTFPMAWQSMRAPSHTRSASGALTLSVLHASTPKLVSSHPRCHTIDSLPFMTKFFASSHSADRCPSPLFHAVHVARGPSQVGRRPRPHLCLGRTL